MIRLLIATCAVAAILLSGCGSDIVEVSGTGRFDSDWVDLDEGRYRVELDIPAEGHDVFFLTVRGPSCTLNYDWDDIVAPAPGTTGRALIVSKNGACTYGRYEVVGSFRKLDAPGLRWTARFVKFG